MYMCLYVKTFVNCITFRRVFLSFFYHQKNLEYFSRISQLIHGACGLKTKHIKCVCLVELQITCTRLCEDILDILFSYFSTKTYAVTHRQEINSWLWSKIANLCTQTVYGLTDKTAHAKCAWSGQTMQSLKFVVRICLEITCMAGLKCHLTPFLKMVLPLVSLDNKTQKGVYY